MMAKTMGEIGVDHEYAPGMEPRDPSLFELFWEWSKNLQWWDFADSAFVIVVMLFAVMFFSACLAVGRMMRLRAERKHAAEIEARKLARERGVAEARRQFATAP